MKAVIFDIDGTIMDTGKIVLNALLDTLHKEGYSHTLADVQSVFGIPGKEAVRKLGVDNPDELYRRWYETEWKAMKKAKPFPGIEEAILELSKRDSKLGIVTSKTEEQYRAHFEYLPISRLFKEVVVAEHTEQHKPHGEPLQYCLGKLGVNPEDAIYIGDTKHDYACAKEAGAKFGLALWGVADREGIEADYEFRSPDEIVRLLE